MAGKRCLLILCFVLLVGVCEMKRKKKESELDKQFVLQRKETTPVDFSRLVVMRLLYGLAKAFGFEENISGVLNGALVPPGADDDDDYFEDGIDGIEDIFDGGDY